MPNNTATAKQAWVRRHRELVQSGFAVDIFGNATTVFLLATCEP